MQLRKILTLSLILCCLHLFGQKSDVLYNYYTIADGLSDNFISDIVKDNNGYVWMSGQNGLTRYDGNNFWVFNSKNQKDFFQSDNISKLYSTGDKIYLLSREEGLIELDPIKLTFKKTTDRGIVSMYQKKDTLISLYNDGFLEIKTGKSPIKKRLLKYNSKDDVILHNSKIYVSSYHFGIFEYDISTLEQKRVFYDENKTGYFIYPSKKFGVVFNMHDRLMVLDANNELKYHPEVSSGKTINSYTEVNNNNNLVISQSRMINISDSLSFYDYIKKEIPNVELRKIIKINERTILIASNQGLIKINYNHQEFINDIDDNSFFTSNALRVRRKILTGEKNKLYMLGYPYIVEYDIKTKVFKNLFDNKTQVSYYDGVIVDSVIYATSEGSGFYSYDLGNKKHKKIQLTDLDSLSVLIHVSSVNDSILLIGGQGNIIVYNIKSNKNQTYPIGKKLNVYDIEQDKSMGRFLAATDIGLLHFTMDKDANIVLSKKTVPTKTPVKDILVDEINKHVWLATNHGLELRQSNDFTKLKEYSKPKEISHQKVTALYKDKYGRIWASTFSGITVIDYKNNKNFFIDRFDGLRNEEFNYKSFAQLKDNRIVFGGINMYDIIDPEILNNKNYFNNFFITGVQKTNNGKSKYYSYADFKAGKISFETGKEDLYIYLSNFDFAEKSGYSFEFKKANYDWIPVVKSRIRLSNDRAGTYKISVRMLNPMGIIVGEKSFFIVAKVPFYQTNLFFILIAVVVSLLSIISIILFLKNIKIENKTKERIAKDLHDEVGTTLTKLMMLVKNKENTATDNQLLKLGLEDSLYSTRAFIDSMSTNKHNLKEFDDDIKDLLLSFKELNPTYKFVCTNHKLLLSQELYRDLKLCIYDSLQFAKNNLISIEIELIQRDNQIILIAKYFNINKKVLISAIDNFDSSNYIKRTDRHFGSFEFSKNYDNETLSFIFEI